MYTIVHNTFKGKYKFKSRMKPGMTANILYLKYNK